KSSGSATRIGSQEPEELPLSENILHRLFAEDGHAPQQAPLARGEIAARVQRATVVPHHDVADAPDMLVDEFLLLLVIKKLLQDRLALLARQAFDFPCHQAADIERPASR